MLRLDTVRVNSRLRRGLVLRLPVTKHSKLLPPRFERTGGERVEGLRLNEAAVAQLGRGAYPGGCVLTYDPPTGVFTSKARLPDGQGVLSMAVDTKRKAVYAPDVERLNSSTSPLPSLLCSAPLPAL